MIVVAGEALVDLVIASDGSVTAKLGGGPFNVARTIGRLGGPVTYMGAVSTDRFGQQLHDALVADDVDVSATVRTERPTTLAAAELGDDGAANYRFYVSGTSAPSLDHIPQAALEPAALHIGTLGLVLEPLARTIVDYLYSLGPEALVIVDPNCRAQAITDRDAYLHRLHAAYRRSHVVKLSVDDAEFLDDSGDAFTYARSLFDHGVRLVLITGGAAGAWVVSPDRETEVPAKEIELVDTIGAGDSFGGGLLAWWLQAGFGVDDLWRHDVAVAATVAANEVAAFTCGRSGADPPRSSQLSEGWSQPWTDI